MIVAACAAVSACSTTRPPARVGAAACADIAFPIYFATGSDQLSDPARAAVSAGAAQVHGCAVREVDVLGLADADGSAAQNLELSRRRADAVAQALIATGLPRPLFDVQGLGEAGARTASGASRLLQRKTQVVIHVTPA